MQWQGPAFPKWAQTHCDFSSLLMKPEQKLLDSIALLGSFAQQLQQGTVYSKNLDIS